MDGVWNRDSPSPRGVVATGDLTNRAEDTFNVVPRRHHLSWCNFRGPNGVQEEAGSTEASLYVRRRMGIICVQRHLKGDVWLLWRSHLKGTDEEAERAAKSINLLPGEQKLRILSSDKGRTVRAPVWSLSKRCYLLFLSQMLCLQKTEL